MQNGYISYDCTITGLDALMAIQAASGLLTLNDFQKSLVDVNKDGRITSVDALRVLQFATGLILDQ